MNDEMAKEQILGGTATLGIELGSTRVKACLVGSSPLDVLAVGSFEWKNQLVDGLWTYSLDSVWEALSESFANLKVNVQNQYGVELTSLKSLGVSGMMHGYLAFGADDELLTPFRTWRNTNTGEAANFLAELFDVNIPLRWSIAHLHQALIDKEVHVSKIEFVTTLAGYVHWKLTGQRFIGIGDASGMFPVDSEKLDFDWELGAKYEELAEKNGFNKKLKSIFPEVLVAGAPAGNLTESGAKLLDPSGNLEAGVPVCPPEGDAGSGMVATNAVEAGTGNVSAGTSIFAMVVMDKTLQNLHHEIDLVTTPTGKPVAMVHCNNGASELASWVGLFERFSELTGKDVDKDKVYEVLFKEALEGEPDAGGLIAYNYLAGEPVTGTVQGRPLFVRTPESDFSLANTIKAQIFGMFGTLSIGMEVLRNEHVTLDRLSAHGGIFRTQGVAQSFLAAALDAPVSVATRASEGGAWGAAVLACFMMSDEKNLSKYLMEFAFRESESTVMEPDKTQVDGYKNFLERYRKGLELQKIAVRDI